MRIRALLLVVVCLCVPVGQLAAQNVIKDYFNDYFVNVPRSYSPDDPWTMGKILRTEVGHGGFFYNCDSEECKRYSPYISWNRQSSECKPYRPVRRTISQQFEEIKQRIRWGSCQTCGNDCQCNGGGGQWCQAGAGQADAVVDNDSVKKQMDLAMKNATASRQLIENLLHGESQDSGVESAPPTAIAKSTTRSATRSKAQETTVASQPERNSVASKAKGFLARFNLPKKTRSPIKNSPSSLSSESSESGFRMIRR